MKADELRVEAERRNLSTSGTKAELIARLEKSDRMVAEQPADAGMFPVEQEVQGVSDPEPSEGTEPESPTGPESPEDEGSTPDSVLFEYATLLRALVAEISVRLEQEAVQPLAELEPTVAGPRSAAVVVELRRVRSMLAAVRDDLRRLDSAAARLARSASL